MKNIQSGVATVCSQKKGKGGGLPMVFGTVSLENQCLICLKCSLGFRLYCLKISVDKDCRYILFAVWQIFDSRIMFNMEYRLLWMQDIAVAIKNKMYVDWSFFVRYTNRQLLICRRVMVILLVSPFRGNVRHLCPIKISFNGVGSCDCLWAQISGHQSVVS